MTQSVPAQVERDLRGTLTDLWSIYRIITETRDTIDKEWGGNGRYEADAYMNRYLDIRRGLLQVDKFRRIAATKDIDAEAFIVSLGGAPDFHVSANAMDWLEGNLKAAELLTFLSSRAGVRICV